MVRSGSGAARDVEVSVNVRNGQTKIVVRERQLADAPDRVADVVRELIESPSRGARAWEPRGPCAATPMSRYLSRAAPLRDSPLPILPEYP